MLPGDNCIFMTRDAWCERTANHNSRHGAEQLAEHRAKRRTRLTQIGQKVEVLVLEQRDWYVGKVVHKRPNNYARGSGGGQASELLAVKFSNGSVLRNVRPSELRHVPRATWVYWALMVLIWVVFAVSVCLNLLAVAHSYRVGPHGDIWLFPDHAFARLPNTTLYNLNYGVS